MTKRLLLTSSVSLLFFLPSCDSKKRRGSAGENGGEPIALISQSIATCESYLGSPRRIHQVSPEARSYLHQGLHIQISYERGESIAVVFSKATEMGSSPRGLTDADRDLIYKLCGTRSDDLELVFRNGLDSWETFAGLANGQSYLLSTDSKKKAMVVMPNTEATWKAMQRYMKTK